MSMEAQFYEARRLQSAIERRQSLRTAKEIERHQPFRTEKATERRQSFRTEKATEKQTRQPEYQALYIPINSYRQADKHGRCTCTALHRIQSVNNDQSLYQRDRDIYPRPLPTTTNIRRRAKLFNRFSSTDYRQQW